MKFAGIFLCFSDVSHYLETRRRCLNFEITKESEICAKNFYQKHSP